MRTFASTAALVVALALGAMGAVVPRVALATPAKDACNGFISQPVGADDRVEILEPGTWCLDHDLASEQYEDTYSMIAIFADDVTIDCRGHQLTYTGFAPNSRGIATSLGLGKRATVRNCRIRGFGRGIAMHDSPGYRIEDNVIEAGIPDENEPGAGILAFGGDGIVRRNRVYGALNRGIRISGSAVVEDNLVDGVTDTLAFDKPIGISVTLPGVVEIRGNRVRGLVEDPANQHGVGVVGIDADSSAGATGRISAVDNVLVHDGSSSSIAFACNGGGSLHYSETIVSGFATENAGCFDAGDNDISP